VCAGYAVELKRLVVHIFVEIVTALDNIHQNTLLHYFMAHNIFPAIVHVRALAFCAVSLTWR